MLQQALTGAGGFRMSCAGRSPPWRSGCRGVVELQAACLAAAAELSASMPQRMAIHLTLARQHPDLMTYERWFDLLAGSRLTRAGLLDRAGDLAWGAVQLTGRTEEAQGIAAAIGDVCEWWT